MCALNSLFTHNNVQLILVRRGQFSSKDSQKMYLEKLSVCLLLGSLVKCMIIY